ncbi:MAG: protease modulator HflC [Bauldia sp.]
MRSIFSGVGIAIIVVIVIVLYFSVFIVDQTEQALVLRFGDPVRTINTPPETGAVKSSDDAPGLYYKLPFVDNVVYFEKRILDLDSPPLEIIASDQKRLVVDAFSRYKIINPLLFYQKVGTVNGAASRLSSFLQSAVRRVLGDASFSDLVRDKRADLMTLIKQQVDQEAREFGIEIVDVKIRSADLPPENSAAIYQRMQTERQRQATEIRAEGEQEARRIRAEADRTATVTVAEANGQASQLQGDGEAERNRVYADAYNQDPDFFAFYRSMLAYQAGLKPGSTRLVISPDSEFFRFFGNSLGSAVPAPVSPATAAISPAATPKPAATPPKPAASAPAPVTSPAPATGG